MLADGESHLLNYYQQGFDYWITLLKIVIKLNLMIGSTCFYSEVIIIWRNYV